MKKLQIDITSAPPSSRSLAEALAALSAAQRQASGLGVALLALIALSFLAGQKGLIGPVVVSAVISLTATVFIAVHLYDRIAIAPAIAALRPLSPSLREDVARLADASPLAQAYCSVWRRQRRELTMAEFEALKREANRLRSSGGESFVA